jgi:hypothetical protein
MLDANQAFIPERIGQMPHLHALKDELATRGVSASRDAVWLFLRRRAAVKKTSPTGGGAGGHVEHLR